MRPDGPRRDGRFGCALEIMLAVLFSLVHAAIAWRLSGLWPGVTRLPPGAPLRVAFTVYWLPPVRLVALFHEGADVPRMGAISDLLLLPMGWITCFVYGWITSLALCLPFRLRGRRRRR